MIRRMTICTAGFLLLALLVAAGPAMAQRGSEGGEGDALAALIAAHVNPHARGEVLTGKLSIRYSLVDTLALDCGFSDFPMNMFYQISLRRGDDNWNFFGYGGTSCFLVDLEGQVAALQNFIGAEVIPNIFRGTPNWAFKSISGVQELPAGIEGFGFSIIEETTLMNFSIAVRGSFRR